jgi:hypothetical protein
MTYTFSFTTREEYLAQKKEWFAIYKNQIKLIQAAKLDIKKAQRNNESVYPAMRAHREAVQELEALVRIRLNSRITASQQYKARAETSSPI